MENNPLANIFNTPMSFQTAGQTTPAFIGSSSLFQPKTDTETLPYGGGIFNPSSGGEIRQASVAPPVYTPPAQPVVPAQPAAPAQPAGPDLYAKYRDPKTGEIMSPEEYAIFLANKVPKGNSEITNYAGDAMTNPNQSAAELTNRARDLNMSRNDIATGTTDPYGVGNKSGIAYSPAELKAIESAYAGVYDPAINDVFTRLEEKKKADEKLARKEDIVFQTNEAIRQWQATTGTKGNGNGINGGYDFTDTQIADGASAAGMNLRDFMAIESDDIKNFYINPPKARGSDGTMVPIYQNFEEDIVDIESGKLDRQILIDEITNSAKLSPQVKTYWLNQIPEASPEEKETWYQYIWNRLPFVD